MGSSLWSATGTECPPKCKLKMILQTGGSIYRKTLMETKRLEERLGTERLKDTSTTAVQAIFRERSQFLRTIEPIYSHVRTRRPLQIALIAAAARTVHRRSRNHALVTRCLG